MEGGDHGYDTMHHFDGDAVGHSGPYQPEGVGGWNWRETLWEKCSMFHFETYSRRGRYCSD